MSLAQNAVPSSDFTDTGTIAAVQLGRSFKRTADQLAMLGGTAAVVFAVLLTIQLIDASSDVNIPLRMNNVWLTAIVLLILPKFGRWIVRRSLAEYRMPRDDVEEFLEEMLTRRFAIATAEIVASAQQVAHKAIREDEERQKRMIRSAIRCELGETRQQLAEQVSTALTVFGRRLREGQGHSNQDRRRERRGDGRVVPFPQEQ